MRSKKIFALILGLFMVASVLAGCDRSPEAREPVYYLDNPLTADTNAYYSRYTDSWRSVKQEGWGINKELLKAENADKLNRALKLFDYLYSKDGNRIMSYGPDAWVNGTIEYGGRQVPKLSNAALSELQTLASGNYTNYYRFWLGGTMPVGYVKEQGMEYQTVHPNGRTGLDNILTAINEGTIDHAQVSAAGTAFEYTNEATPQLATPATKTTLNLSIAFNADAKITFRDRANNLNQTITGHVENKKWISAADGVEYSVGDLKPVWRTLGEKLNVNFVDKSADLANHSANWGEFVGDDGSKYEGKKGEWDIITASASNFVKFGVGDNGIFINLLDHIEKMPNLKRFLDANPFIKNNCLAGDGKLYYSPYFDGYDDLERMFMMRTDWVEKLLDGAQAPTLDTTSYGTTSYTPYNPETMDKEFTVVKASGSGTEKVSKEYSKNIITVQNELATKNGSTLTTALRNYIDTTYGGYYGNQRSKLFTGVNAAYDADELVALLRCVRANPLALTGSASTDIVPFYPRGNTADRVMDLYRLMSIWGVRGLDARNNFMFVDEDGQVRDARIEPKTLAGLEKLNELYKEKLILQNFDKADSVAAPQFGSDSTFRGKLNQQNRGFMTHDYNQTTTVVNALGDGATPVIPGFYLTPVLPPYTDWGFVEKPSANNPVFRSVPTAFPFDADTQNIVNSFTVYAGSGGVFNISSSNGSGSTGVSNIVFSDLIMRGYGQDFEKGTLTFKFSSKTAFYTQLSGKVADGNWGGADHLATYNLAYQAWYNKYFK